MFIQAKRRGHRSSISKKERRKQYRSKKKCIHRTGKEDWKVLSAQRLRQKWKERSQKSYNIYLAELKEARIENAQRVHLAYLKEKKAQEAIERDERVDGNEKNYNLHISSRNGTNDVLCLDAVLTPIMEQ